MQKTLTIAVILAIILAGFGFVTGPIWAFYDLRSSAQSEDVATLAKLIDFDAVRIALKAELEAGSGDISGPAPDPVNHPVAATDDFLKKAGQVISNGFHDLVHPQDAPRSAPLVADPEPYLKPRALLALSLGAGRKSPKIDPSTIDNKPFPHIGFWSLDRCRLDITGADGGVTVFTYERQDIYSWKLVHIGLPAPMAVIVPKSGVSASKTAALVE